MKFDREIFYTELRKWRGSLSTQQVSGLNFILDSAEIDPYIMRIEWLAYMLSTTDHETAHTFQPIHEYGSHNYFVQRYGGQTALGHRLGNDTPEEGAEYAGEGDVQLTGESNYEKAEAALRAQYPQIVAAFEARTGKRFDLTVGDQPNDTDDPKNAGDPAIAYAIMSYGMRTGMFTGRKLSDYIYQGHTDYLNARRIINGMDRASQIADGAVRFEHILRASLISSDPPLVHTIAEVAPVTQSEIDASREPEVVTPDPTSENVSDGLKTPGIDTSGTDDTPSQQQPAVSITSAGGDVTESSPAVLAAAQNLPDTNIETKAHMGLLGKAWAMVTAIVTGQYVIPAFLQPEGINWSELFSKLFQGIFELRWFIFGILALWFVINKFTDWHLKSKAMTINSDPTKGAVNLVTSPPRSGTFSWVKNFIQSKM